jgi:hypothetical protein
MTTFIEHASLDADECFPSLAQLLDGFLTPQLATDVDPLQPDQLLAMYVERLTLDVPIEVQTLRDADNRWMLGTSTPTQWIETSVQPVWHRLRLTLELDHDEPRHQGVETGAIPGLADSGAG